MGIESVKTDVDAVVAIMNYTRRVVGEKHVDGGAGEDDRLSAT